MSQDRNAAYLPDEPDGLARGRKETWNVGRCAVREIAVEGFGDAGDIAHADQRLGDMRSADGCVACGHLDVRVSQLKSQLSEPFHDTGIALIPAGLIRDQRGRKMRVVRVDEIPKDVQLG